MLCKKEIKESSEPYRGVRCPICFWALYDGDYCQNPNCIRYGKSVLDFIRLSNEEAQEYIKSKQ